MVKTRKAKSTNSFPFLGGARREYKPRHAHDLRTCVILARDETAVCGGAAVVIALRGNPLRAAQGRMTLGGATMIQRIKGRRGEENAEKGEGRLCQEAWRRRPTRMK